MSFISLDFPDPDGFFARLARAKRPLSVKELAAYYGCSQDTVYRAVRDGSLPYLRIRGSIRFESVALLMHFARQFPQLTKYITDLLRKAREQNNNK